MKNNEVYFLVMNVKNASYELAALTSQDKNCILEEIANSIDNSVDDILLANSKDIQNLSNKPSHFLDRLTLNKKRIKQMSDGVREVAKLPDPIGQITKEWNRENKQFKKIRTPLGVIGVIYEARPNVTIDVAVLALKSSNAVVLRGGSEAINTNRMLFQIMQNAIEKAGYNKNFIGFINNTARESTIDLLNLEGLVDVIVPRGGEGLKKTVLENAKMPVIASAGGNCHAYIDEDFNLEWAKKIIYNAKMQRPTVCNALEQLLVNKKSLKYLKDILEPLKNDGCIFKGDKLSQNAYEEIEICEEDEYYNEHLSLCLTIKAVDNVDEAISFINEHSTHHSETIISNNIKNQQLFQKLVDSGCVYVNTSTRFTDGFEFGFGAEIGISTQKLHVRGPIGLEQLTSEKYLIESLGETRK